MATLRITGISDDTLTRLRVRAAAKRQSVEAYVRDVIEREAALVAIEIAAEQRRKG